MSTILLSIKPEYANKIVSYDKRYEYRRNLAKKKVDKIVIYATQPVGKVVGEVDVIGTIHRPLQEVWSDTKQYSGITADYFTSYFKGLKHASAYVLGKVFLYDSPKTLAEFGVKQAPQSFVYIH